MAGRQVSLVTEGAGGGTGGAGNSEAGTGVGGGDISAIYAYRNEQFQSLGTNGDYTTGAGYGGDDIGPVGSRPLAQNSNRLADFLRDLMAISDKLEDRGDAGSIGRTLFHFTGEAVDVYSGLPVPAGRFDPFTSLFETDYFARETDRSVYARNEGPPFTVLRRSNLLSSPRLLADNTAIPCNPNRATCLPEMRSDANQSDPLDSIRAEIDESNVAIQALAEGKAAILGGTGLDVQALVAKAAQISQSDEYKVAAAVNKLRDHPLEIRHSAVLSGLGHMAAGGLGIAFWGFADYSSGGLAVLLGGGIGLAASTAQAGSGLALALSGADSTETLRVSGQLDYVFDLTSSLPRLMFGTTGLVLSGGDTEFSQGFAIIAGIGEDMAAFRGDPSKLYSAILPGTGTKAERRASALLIKDATALGHKAQAEDAGQLAEELRKAGRLMESEEEIAGPHMFPYRPVEVQYVDPSEGQLKLLEMAATRKVVWIAGDEAYATAHMQVMARNPTMWWSRTWESEGYRNAMRAIPMPTPTGPAPEMYGVEYHHLLYPRSSYSAQLFDANYLYVMYPETHKLMHRAFGGYMGMDWRGIQGAEREIGSVFNFWLAHQRR